MFLVLDCQDKEGFFCDRLTVKCGWVTMYNPTTQKFHGHKAYGEPLDCKLSYRADRLLWMKAIERPYWVHKTEQDVLRECVGESRKYMPLVSQRPTKKPWWKFW